ncbi:UDP-N-acetylglucosamine 2-epimerase [Fulvivirga sediminis]|uniref:UDP-N-acetylglucosamine 2-epimerase n=1 Tax=Fulvivirga sediminis TaxID=2803949 RepID=A0A937K348_9BACT|nr:UDP-N-acetylglucosamine 2-epimerase [Fulvivirga sediminis]MBL3659035.1 UDP-N-acetylglucosamine 2-epimerase [Fulvivirga sediminis]
MTEIKPYYNKDIVTEQVKKANEKQSPLYLIFIGTKPCYIKLASLIHGMNEYDVPFLAIDVGQHYDKNLTSAQHELGFSSHISVYLKVQSTLTARTPLLANRINWLYELLNEFGLKDQAIPVVSGDTSTAGLVPVFWYMQEGGTSVHVEAGLRSYRPVLDWNGNVEDVLAMQNNCAWKMVKDAPFPEGFDTRIASVGCQLLFAPEHVNRQNLVSEGYDESTIVLSGSLSSDAIDKIKSVKPEKSVFEEYPFLNEGRWLRVDFHRRENMKPAEMKILLEGLISYMEEGGEVVFVMTNAAKAALDQYGFENLFDQAVRQGMQVTPLWPEYSQVIEFINSEKCIGIYTDSGGLQEESHVLGVRCATYRWNTDRPETINFSTTNVLVPPVSAEFIKKSLQLIFHEQKILDIENGQKLYGDKVGYNIASYLKDYKPVSPVMGNVLNY